MTSNPVVLLTTEPPPIPGVPATGAGLRAWGLLQGLRALGAPDARLLVAADAIRGREAAAAPPEGVEFVNRPELDDRIAELSPRALVFQHWGIMRDLRREPGCPVAIDLAGPHLLERALWGSKDREGDLVEKLAALHRADFVTCSGAFQRNYFIAHLAQAGWDPRAADLCPAIPFSLSPELPEIPADRDNRAFFYGGMFLPWQDPSAVLRAALRAVEGDERARLVFVGGPHPSADVGGGRFDGLLLELRAHPRVEYHAPMPFPEMVEKMRRCGLALDLMPANAERLIAFPTRTVAYLWAGVPPLHNNYDELAGPIDAAKAGWALDPGDAAGMEELLERALRRPQDTTRRAEAAQRLAADRYTWDRTTEPLAAWCRDPRRRERGAAVAVPGALAAPPPAAEPTARKRSRAGAVSYTPRTAVTGPGLHAWLLSPIVFLLALPISLMLVLLFALVEIVKRLFRR
ncbi:MAG: hypothetical protein SF028_06250 [Candidatus Sumerlaeia bacterium]|nr:hypothetical protein [Candidatus Sumerlaeia bacterium]